VSKIRSAYRVQAKRNGAIILKVVTSDVSRMGCDIKVRYPDAIIEQVGRRTTWKVALKWAKGGR